MNWPMRPTDEELKNMHDQFFKDAPSTPKIIEWFAMYGVYLIREELRRRGVEFDPYSQWTEL